MEMDKLQIKVYGRQVTPHTPKQIQSLLYLLNSISLVKHHQTPF